MGSVVSGLFGGSANMPSIDVEDAITPPAPEASIDPVSNAVRSIEQKRLKARRAFAGTLLSGGKQKGGIGGSLLGSGGKEE